jgi:hypothetical protein
MKRELAITRENEKVARAELAKLREEVNAPDSEKSDDDDLTSMLVFKHSAKNKVKKPDISRRSQSTKQSKGRQKAKDSDQKEEDSSEENKEDVSGCNKETDPLENSATDVVRLEEVNQNIEKTDQTTPMETKESNDEKTDKCEGHSNLFRFLFEENATYCAEGQKFGDARCMKCSATFTQKETKPTSNRPIHFCPYFEEVCDAVLCHGCYISLNSSTISTRNRRNRNNNL